MTNNNVNPEEEKQQGKGTNKFTQLKTIFQYLKEHTATASMVAKATGVPQKNICRYKRDLEKGGCLIELFKGYCQETGHSAWYLTTNSELFPKSNQLNLF